jgi:hypothetical protein
MNFPDDIPGLELEGTLEDLKLIYRVLHIHLAEHEELLDSPLFTSLQEILQQAAYAEGVDVTDHAQWQAWLSAGLVTSSEAPEGLLN